MTTIKKKKASGARKTGKSKKPVYRLLTNSDRIAPTDEFLDDDFTWKKVSGRMPAGMINMPYNLQFFQPMRRSVEKGSWKRVLLVTKEQEALLYAALCCYQKHGIGNPEFESISRDQEGIAPGTIEISEIRKMLLDGEPKTPQTR